MFPSASQGAFSSLCNRTHGQGQPPPEANARSAQEVLDSFEGGRRRAAMANWGLPDWVLDGFIKDPQAKLCQQVQDRPFLMTGVRPAVGQRLYMNVHYLHDGSHPLYYKGWARMVGEVTEVLPPPPVGVYAIYDDQEAELTEEELAALRATLPALPPSHFQNCKCGDQHTVELVVGHKDGAVHGQRLKGRLRLSADDEGYLEPQLAGWWDVELICNENKSSIWEICKMAPAGPIQHPVIQDLPPGRNASPCMCEYFTGFDQPGPGGIPAGGGVPLPLAVPAECLQM